LNYSLFWEHFIGREYGRRSWKKWNWRD
jgi:hypothetical protein